MNKFIKILEDKRTAFFITSWTTLFLVLAVSFTFTPATWTVGGYEITGYLSQLLSSVALIGIVNTLFDITVRPVFWVILFVYNIFKK